MNTKYQLAKRGSFFGLLQLAIGVLVFVVGQRAEAAGWRLDTSFGAGQGYVTLSTPYVAGWAINGGLALPDGRAVIGGYVDTRFLLRRYLPSGVLDSSFGNQGTLEIPDFERAESFGFPAMTFTRNGRGEIVMEERGIVRRVRANGQLDPLFRPRELRWTNRMALLGAHHVFAFDDDRVATLERTDEDGLRLLLRYFLADGNADTARGAGQGETLVPLPANGRFGEVAVAYEPDGKILVAVQFIAQVAQVDQGQQLLVYRFNAGGVLDSGFASSGLAVLDTEGEPMESLALAIGGDRRIALSYESSGWNMGGAPSRLALRLLKDDGSLELSFGDHGRLAVILPNDPQGPFATGGNVLVSGPPRLAIAGPRLLWQMDLSVSAPVPAPLVRSEVCQNLNFVFSTRLGGDTVWWFCQGLALTAAGGVRGSVPGLASALTATAFSSGTPAQIREQFDSTYYDRIDGLQPTTGGQIRAVHVRAKEGVNRSLVRFLPDGALAGGSSGLALGPAERQSVIRTADGAVLSLAQSTRCWEVFGLPPCQTEGMIARYLRDGGADSGFAVGGSLVLPSVVNFVGGYSADVLTSGRLGVGFVGANTVAGGEIQAQAWIYQPDGSVNSSFVGAVQSVPRVRPGLRVGNSVTRFLAGERLQTLVGLGGEGAQLRVLRWLADGRADPGQPATGIDLPLASAGADDLKGLDAIVLADGKTLFAVFLAGPRDAGSALHRRLVGRLNTDGTLDWSFGDRGWATIDTPDFVGLRAEDDPTVVKLAQWADGRILLGHSTAIPGGSAIAVVRLLAQGAPDPSFVSGGGHELRVSIAGAEAFSDFVGVQDGGLLVSGASKGRALLAKLHGEGATDPVSAVPVAEFYNTGLKHYFVTGGASEMAAIAAGAAGPGWLRTGASFKAYLPESGIAPQARPVCRFYGTPGVGPNSHFYTADPSECQFVKTDPGWFFEGIAFYVETPSGGSCAAGTTPIYRSYNQGFVRNDSNHRYTADATIHGQMLTQGWADEGVVFCAAP